MMKVDLMWVRTDEVLYNSRLIYANISISLLEKLPMNTRMMHYLH